MAEPEKKAITPAAAKLAKELELDVELIEGTGVDGKVVIQDVRRFHILTKQLEGLDLFALGCRVQSVYGAFYTHTMVEMPTPIAALLFGGRLEKLGGTNVVEALERDLEVMAEQSPEIGGTTEAAAAHRLAHELQDPFNSATSKSMCAKQLTATMEILRELAPAGEKEDALDALAAKRAEREQQRDAAA